MPDLTDAITEAYAACPCDSIIYDTLEIRHPSFLDDEGNPTAIRVVNDNADLLATLESDAPMNAGEQVLWRKCYFKATLPSQKDGEPAELQIEISNVTREIEGYLELAVASQIPTEGTYRPYLSTDLTRPHWTRPAHMTFEKVSSDVFKVTATLGHAGIWTKPVPSELYTPARFPQMIR